MSVSRSGISGAPRPWAKYPRLSRPVPSAPSPPRDSDGDHGPPCGVRERLAVGLGLARQSETAASP